MSQNTNQSLVAFPSNESAGLCAVVVDVVVVALILLVLVLLVIIPSGTA